MLNSQLTVARSRHPDLLLGDWVVNRMDAVVLQALLYRTKPLGSFEESTFRDYQRLLYQIKRRFREAKGIIIIGVKWFSGSTCSSGHCNVSVDRWVDLMGLIYI